MGATDLGTLPVRLTFVLEQDAGGNWIIVPIDFSILDVEMPYGLVAANVHLSCE